MMERLELRAQTRTVHGKKVKRLRSESLTPAVIYGPDMPNMSLQLEERSLFRALHEAGSTMLIDLFVDDGSKPYVVLARQIQRDPIGGRLQHVDFYQVRLTEKVRTTPRLEFIGESPVVKSGVGVMIHGMTEIEVECLPTDLISSIPVDVTGLEGLDDNVLVRDLPVPAGVTILADPGDLVVSVVPTRMAIVEEVEEEEVGVAEGEEVEGEEAGTEAEPEA